MKKAHSLRQPVRLLDIGKGCALSVWLALAGCGSDAQAPAEPTVGAAVAPTAAPPQPPPTTDEPAAVGPTCADGDVCFRDAMAALRGGDPSSAAERLSAACDSGHPRSCFKLGELMRDGRLPPRGEGGAQALIERACRDGHAAACDALGH